MSSNLQSWYFNNQSVRLTVIGREIWFVARDFFNVLHCNYESLATNPLATIEQKTLCVNKILSLLKVKEHEIMEAAVNNPETGNQKYVILLSVSGVYRLAFASTHENAESFVIWLTKEVLPWVDKAKPISTPPPNTKTDGEPRWIDLGAKAMELGFPPPLVDSHIQEIGKWVQERSRLVGRCAVFGTPGNSNSVTLWAYKDCDDLSKAIIEYFTNWWNVSAIAEGYSVVCDD